MFSEVNIQEYFHDYKIKNFFKAQYSLTIKKNITKLDYIKIKFFKTSLYLKALQRGNNTQRGNMPQTA